MDGESPNLGQRKKFEDDLFPHLEALWNTALWLTMRSSNAEALLVNTVAHAYRTRHLSADSFGSKARLFRILTREFSAAGNGERQPGWVLAGGRKAVRNDNGGGPSKSTTSIDSQELQLLTAIPDVFVKGAVARLRVQPRLIMMLHLREQFSHADIAYITDLSEASIKSNLAMLRRLIPRCIVEHSGSPENAAACGGSPVAGCTLFGDERS